MKKVSKKVPERTLTKLKMGNEINLLKTSETPFKTIGACIRYIPIIFLPIISRKGILLLGITRNKRNKVIKYKY